MAAVSLFLRMYAVIFVTWTWSGLGLGLGLELWKLDYKSATN